MFDAADEVVKRTIGDATAALLRARGCTVTRSEVSGPAEVLARTLGPGARRLLTLREALEVSDVLLTLVPPAALGEFPAEWGSIQKSSGLWSSTADLLSLKPAPEFTYYCNTTGRSAGGSPADNDPEDPVTPRYLVTLANAHAGVQRAFVAKEDYYGNKGPDGNNLTCEGLVLEPWAGQGARSRYHFIKRNTNAAAAWTLDQDGAHFTSHSTANTPVYDFLHTTNGMPYRHVVVGSVAEVRATPGSEFFDSGASRKYAKALDGRSLVGDLDVIVPTGGNAWSATPTIDQTLWFEDAGFIGTFLYQQQTAARRNKLYGTNCLFLGVGSNAVTMIGAIDGILRDARGGGGLSDTWSVTGHATSGDGRLLLIDDATIRSGYEAAGTANNSLTAHNGCLIVAINSVLAGAQNRTVHFINDARGLLVGVQVGASAASDSTGVSVVAGSANGQDTELYLIDCEVAHSASDDLFAYSGSGIHTAEMDASGLATGGDGTIDTFTPEYA